MKLSSFDIFLGKSNRLETKVMKKPGRSRRLHNGSANSLLIQPHHISPASLQEYFCCQDTLGYSFKPLIA